MLASNRELLTISRWGILDRVKLSASLILTIFSWFPICHQFQDCFCILICLIFCWSTRIFTIVGQFSTATQLSNGITVTKRKENVKQLCNILDFTVSLNKLLFRGSYLSKFFIIIVLHRVFPKTGSIIVKSSTRFCQQRQS